MVVQLVFPGCEDREVDIRLSMCHTCVSPGFGILSETHASFSSLLLRDPTEPSESLYSNDTL